MEDIDTVVVGAGPAGLAVAACLSARGVPHVVLERAPHVAAAWRAHYDRLHLHTAKQFSGLPMAPWPRAAPRYPSRAEVVAYLEAYARRFRIEPRTGVTVDAIEEDGAVAEGGDERGGQAAAPPPARGRAAPPPMRDDRVHALRARGAVVGDSVHALGHAGAVVGDSVHALGAGGAVVGDSVHALGAGGAVVGDSVHALGAGGAIVGDSVHALGAGSAVVGDSAHALGAGGAVVGDSVHALGAGGAVVGDSVHALGAGGAIVGDSVLALRAGGAVVGDSVHALGAGGAVVGDSAHALRAGGAIAADRVHALGGAGLRARHGAPTWTAPTWTVRTSSPHGAHAYRARNVVVATGCYGDPFTPDVPGLDRVGVPVVHTSAYKNPGTVFGGPAAGKRALVVGCGNSGAEIALDLAEHGADVTLVVRGPVHVVPRDLFGRPAQETGVLLSWLPPAVQDALATPIIERVVGDLRPFGIERPRLGIAQTLRARGRFPWIDIGTVAAIRAGKIRVRPDVVRYEPARALFADGSASPVDGIVMATGFRSGLARLVRAKEPVLDAESRPLAFATSMRGLYFVGFQLVGTGVLREISREAPRVARAIRR